MLGNSGKAAETITLVKPQSAANTAAATSSGVDITKYEGDLLIVQHVGVITGTLDGKIQVCDDSSGTNPVDVSGATYTQVTTANDDPNLQVLVLDSGAFAKKFIRYVGTVGTGPSVLSVTLTSRPKYIG
jgi:hypothetical protein